MTMLTTAVPASLLAAKPGTPQFRAGLRDGLEVQHGLAATHGISEMTAEDHNGFDERARVMVMLQHGR